MSCSEFHSPTETEHELASLFGFLIDFQALRTDLSGNPTFRELLGRVRQGLLDVEENRAIPFDKVVEIVQPRRDPVPRAAVPDHGGLERSCKSRCSSWSWRD